MNGVAHVRTLGPPGARVPGRARRRGRVRAARDGRRDRRPARGRAGEALLRGLVRRRVLVEPHDPARGARSPSPGYESWILEQVVPFVREDCGGAGELIACGSASGRFTPPTSRSSAPTCSRWRSACRAAMTPPPGTGGASAATPRTSTTRSTTSPTSAASTSSGCACRLSLLLVCGQGQWEDTTGALASTRRLAALLGSKGLRASSTCGGMTSPTTGLRGARSSPTTFRASADER